MTFFPRVAALVVAASYVCIVPALAADCGPLKMINSIDLVPLGTNGLMLMPVTINGVPKKMLLHTAGGATTINSATVDAMGLHSVDTGGNFRLLSSNGSASARFVQLQSLQFGRMIMKDPSLMVAPGASNPNAQFDGVATADLMRNYDVELDFVSHKMNYFSTDHCEGRVIYWPSSVVAAVPFTTTPPVHGNPAERGLPINYDSHFWVPVTVDGKNFTAVISTGSTLTTMSAKVAKIVFGLTPDAPGSNPLDAVSGDPDNKAFAHVFDTLTFEGVTVSHPRIVVMPDLMGSKDPNNSAVTGSHIGHVDDDLGSELTIGMDVLKHLHLYIAYGEHRLYITPASQPAADATPPRP